MKLNKYFIVVLLFAAAAFSPFSSWHSNSALLSAVKNANSGDVNYYLGAGADANCSDNDGTTALHWAVMKRNTEDVRLLLDKGAQADVQNTYGDTPLMWAGISGDETIIRLLLDARPNLDLQEHKRGATALIAASIKGNAGAVKLLLDHMADVTVQDRSGKTALTYASIKGHSEIIKMLLACGATENGGKVAAVRTAIVSVDSEGKAKSIKIVDVKNPSEERDGAIRKINHQSSQVDYVHAVYRPIWKDTSHNVY